MQMRNKDVISIEIIAKKDNWTQIPPLKTPNVFLCSTPTQSVSMILIP